MFVLRSLLAPPLQSAKLPRRGLRPRGGYVKTYAPALQLCKDRGNKVANPQRARRPETTHANDARFQAPFPALTGSPAMDLRSVFARHWPEVLRWASARAPAGEAEDVAADAFEALARHEDEVAAVSVRAWLRTAVGHVAMRRAAKRRELLREVEAVDDVTPEGRLRGAQGEASLLELLDTLEPLRREAFRLHVLDELPITAVAAVQSVGLETARKRIRLARDDLRAAVARERAKGRRSRLGVIAVVADWLRRRWEPGLVVAGVGISVAAQGIYLPPLGPTPPELAAHVVELAPLSFATPSPAAEREPAAATQPARADHDAPALVLLLTAQTALDSGRLAEAAILLGEYDRTRPGDPYAELRARLGAQVGR